MEITVKEQEEKFNELLDAEFLAKLKEVGRLYGWDGDYVEIGGFIMALHLKRNIELTNEDIEPYEIIY